MISTTRFLAGEGGGGGGKTVARKGECMWL